MATVKVDITNLQRKINNLEDAIGKSAEVLAEDIAKMGRARMRWKITTSTTPWGDKRKAEGRPYAGRRESDTMWNAVKWRVVNLVAEWGWIDGTEKYFMIQERIRNMYSLRDSRQYVVDRIPSLLKDFKLRIKQ